MQSLVPRVWISAAQPIVASPAVECCIEENPRPNNPHPLRHRWLSHGQKRLSIHPHGPVQSPVLLPLSESEKATVLGMELGLSVAWSSRCRR